MSLIFLGPAGSFERRWIVYAMLRDNVQHHLEHGKPSTSFGALHAIGGALREGRVAVPAEQLREEMVRAQALLSKSVSEFAVSLRTRAVCTMSFPVPELRDTVLAALAGWTVPFPVAGAESLDDLFGSLVRELMRVTEGAKPGDVIEIVDA